MGMTFPKSAASPSPFPHPNVRRDVPRARRAVDPGATSSRVRGPNERRGGRLKFPVVGANESIPICRVHVFRRPRRTLIIVSRPARTETPRWRRDYAHDERHCSVHRGKKRGRPQHPAASEFLLDQHSRLSLTAFSVLARRSLFDYSRVVCGQPADDGARHANSYTTFVIIYVIY